MKTDVLFGCGAEARKIRVFSTTSFFLMDEVFAYKAKANAFF